MGLPERPEEIPDAFASAWARRDAKALASLFAEDADFVNVVGLWWRSRSDIERAHHYGLTTFFKDSKLSARRVETKLIGDAAATVHVRWRLRGQTSPIGEILEDRFSVMVFVAERRADGWVVVSAHNTDIVPGAETLAASGDRLEPADYRP